MHSIDVMVCAHYSPIMTARSSVMNTVKLSCRALYTSLQGTLALTSMCRKSVPTATGTPNTRYCAKEEGPNDTATLLRIVPVLLCIVTGSAHNKYMRMCTAFVVSN
jgi:hypothetical protein